MPKSVMSNHRAEQDWDSHLFLNFYMSFLFFIFDILFFWFNSNKVGKNSRSAAEIYRVKATGILKGRGRNTASP
jgi:hypothetical protein